jgi:hypothetical protein
MPADSSAVTAELRLVPLSLQEAAGHLTVIHGQVDGYDLDSVRNLRWHVAEAQRLNRHLHRQIEDRLAGPTPEQRSKSQPTSLHDPPHGPPETEDTHTPP